MNKKVLKVAFVAAIALVSGINVFNAQQSEPLSDVALANVEALAQNENETFECLYRITKMCATIDWSIPWRPVMTQYPDSYAE